MRPQPPSLLHKLKLYSTTCPRRDLQILRTFSCSHTTLSILPTAKARANFPLTRRILFSSNSSRRSPATGDNQRQHQHNAKKSSPNKAANKNGIPEFPTLSFDGLGLSRNMKIVVLGLVGVLGTLETWFWCKAIWRWWKAAGEKQDEKELGDREEQLNK